MNTLDKVIGYLAPQRGLARIRARQAMKIMDSYDSSSTTGRMSEWRPRNSSPNAETERGALTSRSRHRDLVRNNPWAARAVQAVVANTVGHGITGELKSGNRKVQDIWTAWAETTACDADGLHDLYGLQALIMRAVAESGDCIVRARARRPSDGLPVPLQLQVLESDYLDHAKTLRLNGGKQIIQGVQFTALGQREGYWLFRSHPGDPLTQSEASQFVPADRVMHIYRPDRPGQVRGMPWGHSAVVTLRDLDGYEDAYLFRQKLANCLTGFVYDHSPDMDSKPTNLPMLETLEPGLIAGLPSGKDIKFNEPPRVDGYGAYTKDVLLRVAAAYGITYQALTGDLSSVNFSSGRMGWLEMHRNIEQWRWHMLIPQFCEATARHFLTAATLAGERIPDKARIEWTPPRREMIDPTKETDAAIKGIRAGITSLPAVHREFGVHTPAVLQEISDSNALIDKFGLTLDSDPRTSVPAVPPTEDNDE